MTDIELAHFSYEMTSNNIALVTLDVPDESMNVLSKQTIEEVEHLLDKLATEANLKGVIIKSGKPDSFVAGADVKMLDACANNIEATALAASGQHVFNRIEQFNVPFVAAIHGICLGGGLEFALACHYRVATDDEKTQLGLPEVKLGLLPGSGGTQRLPQKVGLQAALDMMLTGKQVRAKQALKKGLVDDVVPQTILISVAEKLIAKGMPAKRKVKLNLLGKILERNSFGRGILFDQALKAVEKKTLGNYPAPSKIIEAVQAGIEQKSLQAGLRTEARLFGELKQTPESQQLRNLFFATVDQKKETGITAKPTLIKKALILGGGLMGGGIAYVTVDKAKIPARIKDVSQQGISNALRYSYNLWHKKAKRRFITEAALQKNMMQLSGTVEYTNVRDVDIVIEAVFEDIELKQAMVADVETHCADHTIFASNTSSLPITEIAAKAQRPENVIGLHYFSPVDKMPLAEIIVHEKTSEQTIATTIDFARKQGKTPIVVKDGAGFYVNRILALYMNEAANLVLAGEPIDLIDKALAQFGFPVGALKLLDEVGIDVGSKIGPILTDAFGDRFAMPTTFDALLHDDRKGKKNSRGFYLYDLNQFQRLTGVKPGKLVDESVYTLLGVTPVQKLNAEEVTERCVMQMLNEAARCLEEGIIRNARDGDIGAIFGIGFPPFLGGPFRYIDALGAEHVVSRLAHFESRFGSRFTPCDSLLQMAEENKTFY
ncbi:fatty acid oxidation complex subunit alpha FadJ [Algibacillus agarilyticus]|uniref:fatty acid oxidation complex subunit alpha FadJ n=1 Tax=Algibacillus agarilyticus TaxID=2234133 RepID=UPI000DCFCE86|nr:fatty acid oxidation complex subunit alpha FadJ [Algibacillus agarilyticus]